jgi:hypothetical protein
MLGFIANNAVCLEETKVDKFRIGRSQGQQRKVDKFRILPIIWQHVQTYCLLNMATSELFFLINVATWGPPPPKKLLYIISTSTFCVLFLAKNKNH